MAEQDTRSSSVKDAEFLAEAHERFKLTAEAESEQRDREEQSFKFRMGEQWPAEIKSRREAKGLPCLTMNRLPSQIRQITNEQRQQRPAGQVNPVGDGATVEVAEILQGMVRHIEVNSDEEIAIDNAFECMVTGGRGYWRYLTDYIDDESDLQEIIAAWIENPFTVYIDPSASNPVRSDAMFAFIISDLSPDVYKAMYGKSELAASLVEFQSKGDLPSDWVTKDHIRVAEYFYVEFEKGKRKNGKEVNKRKVKWAQINAIEVLDRRDWPGKWIPIVPVLGDQININGKRFITGLVWSSIDAQRQYNYWITAATQAVALAPVAPWIVAEGQIAGHEAEWAESNRNPHILTYQAMDVNGKPVPPPQRITAEPPIQAMVAMVAQAANDMKAIPGLYDPSLGNAKSDQSGEAIKRLQKQGDLGTLNYSDNLARSIRFSIRMKLDLMPSIYDTERMQRIVKPDGTADMVQITNSRNQGPEAPQAPANEATQ